MEGFTASAKDGFLPEMDIQFLEDGTPVLIHDDTADRVLDEFDERGLNDSLVVQSFDFEAAKTIADRGYTSLYLMGSTMPKESPAEIKDAGIEWVGPSKKLPTNKMRELDKAGFHVAPYTLATAKDGHRLPGFIDGYFTDDAWTN